MEHSHILTPLTLTLLPLSPGLLAIAQFACSTSSQTVPASHKHKAYEEVLIQGNVTADIAQKLQAMYGVPTQLVKINKQGKK